MCCVCVCVFITVKCEGVFSPQESSSELEECNRASFTHTGLHAQRNKDSWNEQRKIHDSHMDVFPYTWDYKHASWLT